MDNQFLLFENINRRNIKSIIKVRVLRAWSQPGFGADKIYPTLELILMDEHGSKMQASVKNKLKPKFESVLVDGVVCTISNFGLAPNKSKYKIIDKDQKITLMYNTKVTILNSFDGPLYGFQFQNFQEVATDNLPTGKIIDVIGCVVAFRDPHPYFLDEQQKYRLHITLEDLQHVQIQCTLFSPYADQFMDFINKHNMKDPIILTFQFARTKDWNDNLTVQNDYYASTLLLNADIIEVDQFKERMVETNFIVPQLNKIVSNSSHSNLTSDAHDFLDDIDRIPLSELCEQTKPSSYTSLATIDGFLFDDDWAYIACKKCTRKVKPIAENQDVDGSIDHKLSLPWKCPKCPDLPVVYLRYKVNINVVDETGFAAFTLFEKDVIRLVGNKTAYDLRKLQDDDDDSVPDELNALIRRTILWKVSVTNFNLDNNYHIYTVGKYTEDEEIISMYKKLHGLEKDTSSTDICSHLTNSDSQGNLFATDDVSATGDNGDNFGYVTPTKSTTISGDSPHGKRQHNELEKEPLSVESTSKTRRTLSRLKDKP